MSKGKIDGFVDQVGFSQLDLANEKLETLTSSMIKGIATAKQLSDAIGGAKNLNELADAQNKASEAIGNVEKSIEKTRLAEIRLQQAREKSFDDFEKKLAKQKEAIEKADAKATILAEKEVARQQRAQEQSEKRTQKEITDSQKRQAQADKEAVTDAKNLLKSQQNIENSRRAYNMLNADLIRLRNEARDIGATFGAGSKPFLDAAARANVLDAQIKKIDKSLGENQRNVGNYASMAFGYVRLLANIIPNFGIGTFFLLLGSSLKQVFDIISGGESILATNNKLNKQANDLYADQSVKVKLLAEEAVNANTSQERQQQILEELNKVSPTYFGNLKDISDILTKLPEDLEKYNKALMLNARVQAGTSLVTEATKGLLEAQRKLTELQALDAKGVNSKGFAAELLKTLQGFGNVPGVNDLFKNVKTEGLGGLLNGSEKLLNIQIANFQKKIQQLSSGIISDQDKLSKNGGDIAGGQLSMQERIANNFMETEKMKLQATIDINAAIVSDEKKSYASRQSALIKARDAQRQILGLQLNQDLNDIQLTNDKKQVILTKYNLDIDKANIEADKKAKELRSKANKDEIDLDNQRLERQKKSNQHTFDDPFKSPKERFEAIQKYESESRSIIKNSEQISIKEAGDNAVRVKQVKEKAASELLDVEIDSQKKQIALQKEINEQVKSDQQKMLDGYKAGEKAKEDTITNSLNNQLLQFDLTNSEKMLKLTEQYREGIISEKSYNRQLNLIRKDAAAEAIDIQISALQKIAEAQSAAIALGFGNPGALQSTVNRLTTLKIQRNTIKTTTEGDGVTDKRLRFKEKAQEALKYGDQAVRGLEIVQGLIDANAQAKIDALEREFALIQQNGEAEKTQINNSLLSAKEKARQTSIIDAQTAQQRARITQQENDIKRKQAEFDKAASIARIIQYTAVAVVESLPNVFLAAIVGALGAAQLAIAVATPLPQFEKGGTVKKDGNIITGEAGTELRIDPSGKTSLTADHANVTYAKAGTKIISNAELVKLLGKPEQVQYIASTSDNRKMEKLLGEIAQGQKQQRSANIHIHGNKWNNQTLTRNY